MRCSLILLCLILLICGCDRVEEQKRDLPLRKLKKDEVIYYLLLEKRAHLAGKSFEEFKRLVVLRDKEFFYTSRNIASELKRAPFTGEELLEVYKTVDMARYAYRNAVDLPRKRQELAKKVLNLEQFAGAEKREIREKIRKEVQAGFDRESELFSVIAHNYVLLKKCRRILRDGRKGS